MTSSLSTIDRELENYFKTAKQLEHELELQKQSASASKEELKSVQEKYAQLTSTFEDHTNKYRKRIAELEAQFRARIKALESEVGLSSHRIQELSRANTALEASKRKLILDLNHHLKQVQAHSAKKSEIENAQFQSQIQNLLASQKIQAQQTGELQVLVGQLQENKKTLETQMDVAQRKLEAFQKELAEASANKSAQLQKIRDLTQQLTLTQRELTRYHTYWSQNKTSAPQLEAAKQQIIELSQSLEVTRRMLDQAQEGAKKESRDKQIALNCLHAAEARLESTQKELDELRKRATESLVPMNTGLRLL